MLKRSSYRKSPIADINVVPYIDVMLVLLVIFMITAPMLTQGVTVDLPKAQSESLESKGREPIIVSVNSAGDYFLNVHDNPNAPISSRDLMLRVKAELLLASETKETLDVLVKGDAHVPYGKVVTAMALLKQAGAPKVGLVTENTKEGETA